MKAISIVTILLMTAAVLCSCASQGTETELKPTEAPKSTPSETVSETVSVDETPSVSDDTANENTAETSYIGALSEKQKQEILDFADEWYKENFSEYKVLSMDFADDDNAGYTYYADLKPGEIIILQVHTTHGSRKKADGTIDGIPRDFFVKITDDGYEFLNEGY